MPHQLLANWRRERSLRVGGILCYSGLILTPFVAVADYIYSPRIVFAADLTLILGCLISIGLLRGGRHPKYFWMPCYAGFWLAVLPTVWTTGGVLSPFLGIALVALFILGSVMDTRERSYLSMAFVLSHLAVFAALGPYLPPAAATPPALIMTVTGATLIGIFICMRAMLRTERRLSVEFSRREAQLQEAQSIARIGSWEWDLENDHITWSEELFSIFNVPKERFDPSFKAYLARLNPVIRAHVQELVKRSIETGEDFVFENQTSDNNRFVFSRGRTTRNADGKVVRLLGTSQDVTDRRLIELELRAAHSELEQRVKERTQQLAESLERERTAKELAENASQAKMQFLANMSHEIRTPMNSILGFSDLLEGESPLNAEGQEYLARIRSNGMNLMRLIDDILDLSKFEAGRIPIERKWFAVKTLVDEVLSSFAPALNSKGIKTDVAYMASETLSVKTDGKRINQILVNLVGNAVKFSEFGTIRIQVATKPLDSKRISLEFEIGDEGIGMSEDAQSRLFQPFSQGDGSIVRKYGGSGLGLALSKRIATALDGDLRLKASAPHKGSTFVLTVEVEHRIADQPIDRVEPPRADPDDKMREYAGRRILLAEDAPDNAMLIERYIRPMGLIVDMAKDGLEAVALAGLHAYDCILMDIQMPKMDGLEATRLIRKQGFTKPIIALTAHALPSEAQRSLSAGCTLHLTKPVNRATLIEAIREQWSLN